MPESRTLSGPGFCAERRSCEDVAHGLSADAERKRPADRRGMGSGLRRARAGVVRGESAGDRRPRDAIARTRAFARGELAVADEIRRRFVGGGAARDVRAPAAAAAARAAGQATAVTHMGAHALGAAAYAAKAAGLAAPDLQVAVGQEIRWQLGHMSPPVRTALRRLPPVASNSSGPLGPGLLASGLLGTIIHNLQAGLAEPEMLSWPAPTLMSDPGIDHRAGARLARPADRTRRRKRPTQPSRDLGRRWHRMPG